MSEKEKIEQAAPASEEKAKKAEKKAEKKSKPGLIARITKWLRELRSELKKVQWPSKKQTINNTLTVLACVAVVGLFIWIFDFVANSAIEVITTLL